VSDLYERWERLAERDFGDDVHDGRPVLRVGSGSGFDVIACTGCGGPASDASPCSACADDEPGCRACDEPLYGELEKSSGLCEPCEAAEARAQEGGE